MKSKLKQWWSTIPPISTKLTLKQLKKKGELQHMALKNSRFSLGTGTNMWQGYIGWWDSDPLNILICHGKVDINIYIYIYIVKPVLRGHLWDRDKGAI